MRATQRESATEIVRRLQHAGYTAYFAGGCVRDQLLGRPADDFDVATNALPDDVRQLFGRRQTKAVGESFGVVLVGGGRDVKSVEVATFRTDAQYSDGRRPDHVIFSTPEEDAQRRDFTINGMFYDPIAERLHDFVGGQQDLSNGLIRAIGIPHDRMREDKLRLLRAVRFAAVLQFEIEPRTTDAVRDMAEEIQVVSAERIAQELRKMLEHRHRARAMMLCDALNLFPQLFPQIPRLPAELRRTSIDRLDNGSITPSPMGSDFPLWLRVLRELQQARFSLALAALTCELSSASLETIGRQLKLSNREIDETRWLVAHQETLRRFRQLSLAEKKELLASPLQNDLVELVRAREIAEGNGNGLIAEVQEFLRVTSPTELNPPPLLSGRHLIEMGLAPGPRFKELLDQIRRDQLNGELNSTEEALAVLQQLRQATADDTP